uniref:Putative LOC100213654 [Hydra vulgaris] n=1 Tax=Lepeophtheirus salmonis TaxID=72036 RepID=A0A0K2TX44_LEPSM
MKFMEKGMWSARSEHLILPLLSSSKQEDRVFRISKIRNIRDRSDLEDVSVRPYCSPNLNWDADSIINNLDWNNATGPFITAFIQNTMPHTKF